MRTVAVRLIIEDLEGSTTVVNLGNEEVTIGRKPHNTIQLTEQNVSRSHAKLNFQDDGWLIHDLGSYNGVKVNGVAIHQPALLRESDLIQIGDYHLTLTDDVARATVDIGPRGAANDNAAGVGMMSSTNDLPSVSVEDLEPLRPQQGAIGGYGQQAQPAEEDKQSKVGIIIGVVGALAAIIGILLFLASNTGGKDEDQKTAEDGKAQKGDAPKKEEPAAPIGDSKEAVPEVAPADSGAAPADDGADDGALADGGEEVPELPAPEPEPEPKPKPKTKTKPKTPEKPKLPPDEALKQARKAAMKGDNKNAYSLAKMAYDQSKSGDALNLMGVAACKMGSASKAKSAYKKMTSKDKATLEKICGPLGITL